MIQALTIPINYPILLLNVMKPMATSFVDKLGLSPAADGILNSVINEMTPPVTMQKFISGVMQGIESTSTVSHIKNQLKLGSKNTKNAIDKVHSANDRIRDLINNIDAKSVIFLNDISGLTSKINNFINKLVMVEAELVNFPTFNQRVQPVLSQLETSMTAITQWLKMLGYMPNNIISSLHRLQSDLTKLTHYLEALESYQDAREAYKLTEDALNVAGWISTGHVNLHVTVSGMVTHLAVRACVGVYKWVTWVIIFG